MSKIISALNDVMGKVAYVQKTGKNSFHGYKYASEADLLDKLRPALIEAGLVLIPSVKDDPFMDDHGNTNVTVEYTLAHVSGEVWPEKIVAVGCGNDRSKTGIGDKGVYKALTGANKYLLFKLFQIETGDDPERDETTSPPPAITKDALPAKLPEPDDPEVTQEEIDIYVKMAVEVVKLAKSSADLKQWADDEKDNRRKYGIKEGTKEHKIIYDEIKKRLQELKAKK